MTALTLSERTQPPVRSDLDEMDALNHDCFCLSLDRDALARELDTQLGQPGLSELVRERCPFVFAARPVFVAAAQMRRMAQVVRAVESVVALPAYLEQPESAALREAYVNQGVVLTPHPQAHALYADKRRLALFSDVTRLQALGVPEVTQRILLNHIPRTEVVDEADGDRLWAACRGLFLKPTAGFGSRAAYRGDKLTRRVWEEILAGHYVAQAIVPPGERLIEDDPARAMKFDLRAYAYSGDVQWVAARFYQGQTTNFRTPGGGFAPVYSTVDASGR
jgi:hypothetical protein